MLFESPATALYWNQVRLKSVIKFSSRNGAIYILTQPGDVINLFLNKNGKLAKTVSIRGKKNKAPGVDSWNVMKHTKTEIVYSIIIV
jgi:hypothetical protein